MPVRPVILNNTPLVALQTLDHLHLLRDLYGQVLIPRAVQSEFLAIDTNDRQMALARSPWIQIDGVTNERPMRLFIGLDRGESEVLALALEKSARLVVMDERRGRRYAQRLGLPLTGTLGVLLLAKEMGLITAVAPLITHLQTNHLYFEAALISRVLQMAGE